MGFCLNDSGSRKSMKNVIFAARISQSQVYQRPIWFET
jgi:hypothetical protein